MFRAALLFVALIAPAFAQMDFSGEWTPVADEDNIGNPHIGEFIGIPMSHAGLLRAEAWNASLYTLPEWQCRPHGAMYISRGPSQVHIWKEVDPVSRETVAFHAEWLRSIDNAYYMDGRPRPSKNAPHTWGGFSLAEWEGDTLKITTTHLKEDYYRRNGVPSSDEATLTQYWTRHGDYLTWVTIAYDPIYLSEPMIRSSEYRLVLGMQIPPYPCTVVEEIDRPSGVVPHYLPGKNPFLAEFGQKYDLPLNATMGGSASMYPELARDIIRAKNGVPAKTIEATTMRQPTALATPETHNGIEIVPVRGNIYLISGAGANITASVGSDGVLLVDSGLAVNAPAVVDTVQRLNHDLSVAGKPILSSKPVKPIRYIVNTSSLADHTGGNEQIAEAGKTFTGGNVTAEFADVSEAAGILAHENTLQRLSQGNVPSKGLPKETYFGSVMKLSHFFNGEGVELLHVPAAVTDGDSIVYFRGSDVIAAGDIFDMTRYPFIDLQRGGSVQGVLAGLNRMLDLVIPEFRSEGGTMVVPGHGRICDTADLAYYRDMITIIRDRIQDMIRANMSLEEVKAARPTEDWDPRFGTNPTWTPDMFVEAVYKSLGKTPTQKK